MFWTGRETLRAKPGPEKGPRLEGWTGHGVCCGWRLSWPGFAPAGRQGSETLCHGCIPLRLPFKEIHTPPGLRAGRWVVLFRTPFTEGAGAQKWTFFQEDLNLVGRHRSPTPIPGLGVPAKAPLFPPGLVRRSLTPLLSQDGLRILFPHRSTVADVKLLQDLCQVTAVTGGWFHQDPNGAPRGLWSLI